MNKNSSWETSVKPVVVLSVIALIVSLLLAMVNSFTAPIIEENQKAATLAAYVDVMPTVSSASDLEEVTDYTFYQLSDKHIIKGFQLKLFMLYHIYYLIKLGLSFGGSLIF